MARSAQASGDLGRHQDYRVVAEPGAMVIMGRPGQVFKIVDTEVLGTRRPQSRFDRYGEEYPRP